MYFCIDKQNLWCNFLTFFGKKKMKADYLKKFSLQFCSFKNFKDFSTLIYCLKSDSNGIFNDWKFNSRSLLKTLSFPNCNSYQCLNNFVYLRYKIKKKNSWNVNRFSPKFLNLISKLVKLMLFTIIYKKIDLYHKRTSSKDSKNTTKIFVENYVFLIKKLMRMKVLGKLERFGFMKLEKKDFKHNLLISPPKKFNFLKLSKLNAFKQVSKFVFSHPFSVF